MKDAPLVRNPELGSAPRHHDDNIADISPAHGKNTPTPFDPPRKSYWRQFWKWTGVFLLLAIAGGLVYFNLTSHGKTTWKMAREFVPAVIEAKQNPELLFDNAGSDIVNILLIGRDVNWKIERRYDPTRKLWATVQVYDEKAKARSDTMIVVSLDRIRNRVHMISLPRDARVRLAENSEGVGRAKLNAAHAYGGPQLLMETIHDELGLTIHHYAVIRFEGFKKLIDQVGGIEVDVIGALKRDGSRGNLDYDDNWGNLHIHLKPGKQWLSGEQAHSYVRFRMDVEGDPGRIKRQQQVMRALAKQMMRQPWHKIAPLVQEVRKQFKTTLSNSEIAAAASFAQGIGDAGKIQPLTMYGVYGSRGSLILNKPKNAQLFRYLFGPTFNETRFLEDSPWTENDEMGETGNSSPGALQVLREAGLIKGKRPVNDSFSDSSSSDRQASTRSDGVDSRVAISESDVSRNDFDEEDRPRPRRRAIRRSLRSTRSTSESNSGGSTSSLLRERENADAPRRELSVSDDESRSESDEEESPARESRSESGSDSPVPSPESGNARESTPATSDSPIPRAE